MRHRKLSRRFSRTSSHRIAMMRNLSISLIEHEVIKTTVEKGKELRRFFEPLVTRAKEDNLHNRRLVISELNSKEAASKLFSDLGPRFKETNGGYIRLIKAGFREGDSFVLTFALENLLNFIDDDKGIIRYGYYSGRVPVIDLRIVDNERYDYSRNAFRYSFDDPFNIDRSTTQSLWRASLGIQYKF